MSLSLDAWTSSNAFLAIVMHWINDEAWYAVFLILDTVSSTISRISEEKLIDFRELVGEHSGENLAHAVYETLNLYGLKGCVSF